MLSSNIGRGGRLGVGRKASKRSRRIRAAWVLGGAALIALAVLACSDEYNTNNYYTVEGQTSSGGSAGEPNAEGGAAGDPTGGGGGAGPEEPEEPEEDELLKGAPKPDTPVGQHEVDLFGASNNRFWFVVNDEQLELMNQGQQGGPIFDVFGDIYTPGGGVAGTYADHLFIVAGDKTADYGKVKTRVMGQSTARPWTKRTLPNIRVDSNEYTKKLRIGGVEDIRFNNGLVGSIFRERITLELYAALGYPVPRSTFAWVGSNVWGPGIWVPYTLVEVYKRPVCERWADALGGGCVNMWEFYGDFGQGIFAQPINCQLGECDNERALELEQLVLDTPIGEGYKAALEDWIDWDSFHRFQCLSWVLATGDDALHNSNNVLLVERMDGLFQWLPYSVDISLGQEWYPEVPLYGTSFVSNGCQSDPSCWADTIAVCEQTITDFENLDPVAVAEAVYETLATEGMLRDGDESRMSGLRSWLEDRADFLRTDLDNYREPRTECVYPLVWCNDGQCRLPDECEVVCGRPPGGVPFGGGPIEPLLMMEAVGGAGGAPGEEPCPPLEYYKLE